MWSWLMRSKYFTNSFCSRESLFSYIWCRNVMDCAAKCLIEDCKGFTFNSVGNECLVNRADFGRIAGIKAPFKNVTVLDDPFATEMYMSDGISNRSSFDCFYMFGGQIGKMVTQKSEYMCLLGSRKVYSISLDKIPKDAQLAQNSRMMGAWIGQGKRSSAIFCGTDNCTIFSKVHFSCRFPHFKMGK